MRLPTVSCACAFAALALCDTASAFLQRRAADPAGVLALDFVKVRSPHASSSKRLPKRDIPNPSIFKRQTGDTLNVVLDNEALLYAINITIGTPPQDMTLQIDTGSSDLWVLDSRNPTCAQDTTSCAFSGTFVTSDSTTFDIVGSNQFSIQYGDGTTASGDYFTDTINIGGATVKNLTMGLGSEATALQAIMGIGYDANEAGAVNLGLKTYPNLVTSMVRQGIIASPAYSLWLNDLSSQQGTILFGGVDTAKYTDPLVSLPLLTSSKSTPTEFFVALTGLQITYQGQTSSIFDGSGVTTPLPIPALLDSGTSFMLLPDAVLSALAEYQLGGQFYTRLGLFITSCRYSTPDATVGFTFGGNDGITIQVGLDELILPLYDRDGNFATDRNGNQVCYLAISPAGDSSGSSTREPVFILGDTFLRSAYVVYDLANGRAAIAQTDFNATDSSVTVISDDIPGATSATARVTGVVAPTSAVLPGNGNRPTVSGSITQDITGGGIATRTTTGATTSRTNAAALATPAAGAVVLGGMAMLGAAMF